MTQISAVDPRAGKKAFKEVEKVVAQIEKSGIIYQNMINANEGFHMYQAMIQLCRRVGKNAAAKKYDKRIEEIRAAVVKHEITGS